jgi:hypothetical protein
VAFSRARLEAPAQTLLLRDRHGRFLGELGGSDATGYGYWPLERLPPRVVAATLAAEDRRFWRHPGVDPVAVARALWQNLGAGRRVSGASTVAMQVARMQRPGRRTYLRKAVEAVAALALTHRYGREQVLAHYLKIVPYGNQVHGISYASRRYLDKPVADLSWAEVAFLAAIPQAPGDEPVSQRRPAAGDAARRGHSGSAAAAWSALPPGARTGRCPDSGPEDPAAQPPTRVDPAPGARAGIDLVISGGGAGAIRGMLRRLLLRRNCGAWKANDDARSSFARAPAARQSCGAFRERQPLHPKFNRIGC